MRVVVDIPNWLYHAIQEHREPIVGMIGENLIKDD